MQFGAQLVNYDTTWEDTLSTIKVVEAGPWHSLWFSDHFLPPIPGAGLDDRAALESWSMITATVAVTKRLQLGILVTGNTYRNPALLAKMAATVDQISNGLLSLVSVRRGTSASMKRSAGSFQMFVRDVIV